MKTSTFIAILFFALLTTVAMNVNAQTTATPRTSYSLDAQGNVVAKSKATKAADSVYQVVNGVTFYKGSKGSIYCLKVSKKTGKEYKSYVTAPKSK
jgi:hypothetical protein